MTMVTRTRHDFATEADYNEYLDKFVNNKRETVVKIEGRWPHEVIIGSNLCDKQYGSQVSTNILRRAMGLNHSKLPKTGTDWMKIGDTGVKLLTVQEAQQQAGHNRRPHRIMAICNACGDQVPAGRLHQHQKAHR
jgi:hypothetical protein